METTANDRNDPRSRGGASELYSFSFDSRSKPVVEQALAEEAKRLKGFFSRKPKSGLAQTASALEKKTRTADLARMEERFIQFYFTHDAAGRVFEALGRLYLEAAAKENTDPQRQHFLIFHALDALSISLQKSPYCINISAQGVVLAVFRLMGNAYYDTASCEKQIHDTMLNMVNIKKDPNDFNSREKIIKLYMQGERFYDALVHMGEYERVMKAKSRPLFLQKKGELAYRKANIFQTILDFYHRVQTNKGDGSQRVGDMNKLSAFITRFNRDNRRFNITPLAGNSLLAIQKTLSSMVAIANGFYLEAAKSDRFTQKYKAYFYIARNIFLFENPKAALNTLALGIREIDTSRMTPKLKAQEKVKFLEFQYNIFTDMGQPRKADEIQKEISRLNKEIRAG